MTSTEAVKVIEACRGWNIEQKSVSLVLKGIRTAEDDLLDARREALLKAWKTLSKDA